MILVPREPEMLLQKPHAGQALKKAEAGLDSTNSAERNFARKSSRLDPHTTLHCLVPINRSKKNSYGERKLRREQDWEKAGFMHKVPSLHLRFSNTAKNVSDVA